MSLHYVDLNNNQNVFLFVFFWITLFSLIVSREYVNLTLRDASNKEALGIAILALVLLIAPVIIVLVRNAVATIQVNTVTIQCAKYSVS